MLYESYVHSVDETVQPGRLVQMRLGPEASIDER